ncbi:MAG TPA: SDR family NAD(P)-dependent oxidoreductase [Chitinivibrionales bacterium]
MEKRALITGASDGIGNVFAKKLSQKGYTITGVARNESKLKGLIQDIGQNHKYIVADLSSEAGQLKTVAELNSAHYDLLVNNAGVGVVGAFTEASIDKQLAMMRLNCEAVVRLSHAYLTSAQSGDALINISSTIGFTPMPSIGLYCATKAFVTSFSESLWFEQKAKGVFVMDFCPGITSTNFQVNAGGRTEDLPKNMAQTPEMVVDNALKALDSRKRPTEFSGMRNWMFANMSRLMPRKMFVNMLGKIM